jgi:hypothetical protein
VAAGAHAQLATHSVRVLAIPLLLAGLVAGVAPAASASAARTGARLNGAPAGAAAATSNPIVGDWHVTYGNRAVVKMTLKAGKYTETAKTRIRVVGSSCYLPAGTVIATFHSTGSRSYSGRHGLWWTSNCSFAYWTSWTLKLSRDGQTLTGVIPAVNETIKFSKITAVSAGAVGAYGPRAAPSP